MKGVVLVASLGLCSLVGVGPTGPMADQPAQVGHHPLSGAPVLPIGLDDLQVPVGVVAALDRGDAREHRGGLRALAVGTTCAATNGAHR